MKFDRYCNGSYINGPCCENRNSCNNNHFDCGFEPFHDFHNCDNHKPNNNFPVFPKPCNNNQCICIDPYIMFLGGIFIGYCSRNKH